MRGLFTILFPLGSVSVGEKLGGGNGKSMFHGISQNSCPRRFASFLECFRNEFGICHYKET